MTSLHILSKCQSALKPQHRKNSGDLTFCYNDVLYKEVISYKKSFHAALFISQFSLNLWCSCLAITTGYTAKLRYANFISPFHGYRTSKINQLPDDSFPKNHCILFNFYTHFICEYNTTPVFDWKINIKNSWPNTV
jgi:hypothetical protein